MKMVLKISVFTTLLLLVANAAFAQAKKPKAPVPVEAATPSPTPEAKAAAPVKRNERPGSDAITKNTKPIDPKASGVSTPTYIYEFTRPGFTYGRVLIEHDTAGKGNISFLKDGYDELITDPINLSPVTLTKINDALTELNFLDSTEEYQYVRDYSHLGNMSFTLKRDGRARTAKYNWTENKGAKGLMDEYRRISNEYTWKFEILIARQNQPLLTPGLMEMIDSYIGRGEVSDPSHLLPFLTELSTDERLPLIARNRATKIIKQIGKTKG